MIVDYRLIYVSNMQAMSNITTCAQSCHVYYPTRDSDWFYLSVTLYLSVVCQHNRATDKDNQMVENGEKLSFLCL